MIRLLRLLARGGSKVLRDPAESPFGWPETILATVAAFGVGLAVISFLMRYISTRSFLPFVIYRLVLGAVLLVLLSLGVLEAF